MLEHIPIEDILFLDIETVPQTSTFAELDDMGKILWEAKAAYWNNSGQTTEEVYGKAGIYAEFGKIVCISIGYTHMQADGKLAFRTKSCYGDNEALLLHEFVAILDRFAGKKGIRLCAHNGKEFDFPYISRRMLIHGISLPTIFDLAGKKPWEVTFLDTMELWKFGDYKHYTSLKLLAHIFHIPSPKDDIDGSQVAKVYWEDKDLLRIVHYCEKDVLTIAQLFLKYQGKELIAPENVSSATSF